MTDDLGPLRQAMSDLAEHGGTTDLYERTLHKSRQTQRRTAVIAGAAAAAVVFAIGGAVAYATAGGPDPSRPVATKAPAPSVTPSAAPSPSTPSPAPSTKRPPSAPPSSTRTSDRPRYPDCPSAKALERLYDLPKDTHFVASTVDCWRGWATAGSKGPYVGDGIYLFKYKAGTGWRYHSQGSGYHCQDLGITSGNPPFCEMD